MANVLVNSLPEYVAQNHDSLLRDAVLGAESAKLFTLQTGVKTKTALNLLNTSVVFQDGSSCGFNSAGSQTISQRTITAPVVKVNMEYCDKTLLNSCLQHEVRIAAGQKTLPFEQDFIADVVANVALGAEKLIWQGDTSKTTDAALKWTDGLIKILKAEDGITINANKLTHATITKNNVRAIVDDVIAAIPTEILNRAVVFMGYDTYRTWIMALQAANLYHNAGDNLDKGTTTYQGSNIKIKALPGLNGTSEIVAADPANFFYGTDMQNDEEKFDFWYSKDDQLFKLAIEFALGVQVAFPNRVIISSYDENADDETTNPSGIELKDHTAEVTVGGDTLTLEIARKVPSDAVVTWGSSANGKATVEDGVVTAVEAGTAVISASITKGTKTYTDSCTVTVKAGE